MKKLKVALLGSPNVGKSTLFNALTGANQHVGNWPGKTVELAFGKIKFKNYEIELVDLPGIYSLKAETQDEEVARDFILSEKPDALIVVIDITQLERNLALLLQILELTNKVVIAVTMVDILDKNRIPYRLKKLEELLGVPVVKVIAIKNQGLKTLLKKAIEIAENKIVPEKFLISYPSDIEIAILELERYIDIFDLPVHGRWLAVRLLEGDPKIIEWLKKQGLNSIVEFSENLRKRFVKDPKALIAQAIFKEASEMARIVLPQGVQKVLKVTRKIDSILLNRYLGIPFVILVFLFIFWLTLYGASPFSEWLDKFFILTSEFTKNSLNSIHSPAWLTSLIVDGIIAGTGAVISVMLPTMSIFFILFALFEDWGLIPRVAFNIDRVFKIAGTQGKHAITCMLSYGCNVPGVYSTRIMKGKERIIAVLTANLNPCNGRLGPIMALSLLFFGKSAFLVMTLLLAISWFSVLLVTFILSKLVFRGQPSPFILELPPYRKPYFKEVIWQTVKNKIWFVLWRATLIAVPFSIFIWILTNVPFNSSFENTPAYRLIKLLEPFSKPVGLNGKDFLSLLFAMPAKELVLAALAISYGITKSLYVSGSLFKILPELWTPAHATSFLSFYMFYVPCLLTLMVIYRETKSLKLTLFSILISLLVAYFWSFILYRLFLFIL